VIVADSSAWIELLRATDSPVDRTLSRLLDEDAEIAVTEMVIGEILSGARSEGEHTTLNHRLLAFPVLLLGGLTGFQAAARLFSECWRRGEPVRKLADCLVAIPAIEAGAAILHSDRDFDRIARCSPLTVVELDSA